MGKVITTIIKQIPVILLCLFSFSVSAQKLYFCTDYSQTGEPKGVAEDWPLNANGTEVFFLYNNGKTTLDFTSLFFVIENKTNGKSDKVEFKVAQNRNWDVMKYTFKEAGMYSVSAFGKENKLLAKAVIKVGEPKATETVKTEPEKEELKKEEAKKEEVKKEEPKKEELKEVIAEPVKDKESAEVQEVLYYNDIKVIFCEQVKEGKIVNEKTSFKMTEPGTYVEIVLQCGKPLNTDVINVDVWKKDQSNSYTEYVIDQEVKLDSKSRQVNFHHSFFKPGDYKISFFNNENVWMTSGYVSVK